MGHGSRGGGTWVHDDARWESHWYTMGPTRENGMGIEVDEQILPLCF